MSVPPSVTDSNTSVLTRLILTGTGYDKNAEATEKLPVDETVDINASKVGEGSRSDSDENVNSSTQLEADAAVQVEDDKA